MTDREKMIEVMEECNFEFPLNDRHNAIKLYASRLIKSGFGRVEKSETMVDRFTRNLNEENRE